MDLDISIRLNTFLSFENKGIGSIQFNGELMMLPAKFAWILTPKDSTRIWLSQQDIVFNLNYIFKSSSHFFFLDLKTTISNFKLSETCLVFSIDILRHNKLEWVS